MIRISAEQTDLYTKFHSDKFIVLSVVVDGCGGYGQPWLSLPFVSYLTVFCIWCIFAVVKVSLTTVEIAWINSTYARNIVCESVYSFDMRRARCKVWSRFEIRPMGPLVRTSDAKYCTSALNTNKVAIFFKLYLPLLCGEHEHQQIFIYCQQ